MKRTSPAFKSDTRRSKRIKAQQNSCIHPDLEDAVLDPATLARSLLRNAMPHDKVGSRATKVPRKPKSTRRHLETPHPPPARWKEVFDAIKNMRARGPLAPVDTTGCQLAHLPETDPAAQRFSTLVSLMLSVRTKDQVCDAAVKTLRAAVGGSLTVAAICDADYETISGAINKVGMWLGERGKAVYLKNAAEKLRDNFNSEVPKTADDLQSLKGVGPKVASLTMQMAWNIYSNIGVDTHVHRITNRLGWHQTSTKNAEETRLNLESWFPKELWPQINSAFVGFGQMVCAEKPKCNRCDLSKDGLCPSAKTR